MGGWPEYVRAREEARAQGVTAPERPRQRRPRRAGAAAEEGARRAVVPREGGEAATAPALQLRRARPRAQRARRKAPSPTGPSKNRLREQQKAEQAVEAAEEALRALEDELADPASWATRYEAAKSEARHTAAKRAVDAGVRAPCEFVGASQT